MNKNILLTAAVAALTIVPAGAQDLNPTVEILNAFEGKLVESSKPDIRMDVPDSLMKFDLEFDYSVFSTGYSGGYDFAPYLMDMRPAADSYRGGKFYLKAGAGYTLNPVFDVVYSPLHKGSLKLDIYASNNSYIGSYRNIGAVRKDASDDYVSLLHVTDKAAGASSGVSGYTDGYDFSSAAGVNLRYDHSRFAAVLGAGWKGLNGRTMWANTNYNILDANVGVYAKSSSRKYFHYDASVRFRYGVDDIAPAGGHYSTVGLNQLDVAATLGPVMGESSVLVDVGASLANYSNLFGGQVIRTFVAPKYIFEKKGVRIALGVKLSTVKRDGTAFEGALHHGEKSQVLYPDIHASFNIMRDYLNVYASVTGGETLNTYPEMKEKYHFFNPYYGRGVAPAMDNSIERFNARIGLMGNVASLVRFGLSAGFATYANALVETVYAAGTVDGIPAGLLPGVSWQDCSLAYAEASLCYDRKPVFADARVRWDNIIAKAGTPGFPPAKLTGMLRLGYNHNDRIRVSVYGDFALARNGNIVSLEDGSCIAGRIPGFVDLGVHAEYAMNRRFSIFANVGNILNSTVQRNALYAENGINATAGVVLNF